MQLLVTYTNSSSLRRDRCPQFSFTADFFRRHFLLKCLKKEKKGRKILTVNIIIEREVRKFRSNHSHDSLLDLFSHVT